MRAEIVRKGPGFKATFKRELKHDVKAVWDMLTKNDKLQQWFSELKVEKLGKDGLIVFDMGDGTVENMAITDYREGQVMAFEWGEDDVRFELTPKNGSTELRLIETINKLTPHTPKDLAGWHVCLDTIEAVLENEEFRREEEWNEWYPEYKRLLESMSVSFE
ncbi:SRPBCC domain-containing protein [Planococcus salinus]|uniref:Activator of Hsp90 ATPase 1 family protein n=1 Tax=Planococcus salinus TaxID=1848460 RepID=A0A3M8P877_9BACL|nr:SRPBCC domain-containing protein [Planococcus salinus]RNF39470.1 activator of Hsp90 ATPase 1 family protein [Planococcus salinus]